MSVICNGKFEHPALNPYDYTSDVDLIQKVMTRRGFYVRVCNDYTLERLRLLVQEYSTGDYTHYDSIWLVIISHGTNNDLLWARDGFYRLLDLFIIFTNSTWFEKPKIIIWAACRGGASLKNEIFNYAYEDELDFHKYEEIVELYVPSSISNLSLELRTVHLLIKILESKYNFIKLDVKVTW